MREGARPKLTAGTAWPAIRTVLANERTFSAWVRTGIASVVAGLGIAKLTALDEYHWIYEAIGLTFITVGGAIFIIATISYRRMYADMENGGLLAPSRFTHLRILAAAMLFIAGLSIILILL